MRLLFLVSSLPISKIGGTEIMTLRICEHLARAGTHEPFIYTIAQSEEEKKAYRLQDMCKRYDLTHFPIENIRFTDRINDDGFLSYTRANMHFIARLPEILKEIAPDILIAMKIQPPDLDCDRIFLKLRNYPIPLVVMIRGFTDLRNSPSILRYGPHPSPFKRIQNWLFFDHALPKYLKQATMVISQTAAQSVFLNSAYGIESPVIFNPIDHQRIVEVLGGSEGTSEEGGKHHIKLIYVGSMIPRKNVPLLLDALRILRKGSRNDNTRSYTLTMVGGGRGESTVKEKVTEFGLGDEVRMVGKLSPDKLWPLMADHDIFVFPSLSEGFPNVLLEAMACGLPIVSSDFLGVRDIIQSEKNGSVCDARDANDMAEKIAELVEDDLYREIGENNREFVKQFTWEKYMARLEQFLLTVEGGRDNGIEDKAGKENGSGTGNGSMGRSQG